MNSSDRGFVYDIVPAFLWFMVIAAANALDDLPVRSIFPYLIPVLFIAWRQGVVWGFLFAGVAAIASGIHGVSPGVSLDWYMMPVITTYLKISGAVIGISIGKRIAS